MVTIKMEQLGKHQVIIIQVFVCGRGGDLMLNVRIVGTLQTSPIKISR